MKITPETIQRALSHAGYYLSCPGCDVDAMVGKGRTCTQKEMWENLAKELNKIVESYDDR